jgi:NAD(P)-dependent dehydrogenase (short-subunit alcohol dehydrogenase family)
MTAVLPDGFVSSLFNLENRVAVVTGGASGLGAAIAAGLAQAGAAIAVVDVDAERAAETCASISDAGGTAAPFTADVTDSSAVDGVVADVIAGLGPVDVLVNSAGTGFRSPAEEFPEDRFDAVLALNLKGTFLTCQRFGRQMLAQGKGSIVNIASIGGVIAYPHTSAYLASKGGVVQLTRALAVEWIGRVRVNAIAPTLFNTPMTAGLATQSTVTTDFIEKRMLREGRLGEPHELVGAAVFLASDASSLVTGHTLPVDDGYLIV